MERSLEGRVAVVTGAGTRLGRAIAEGLGLRGASVVVHYASSRGGAEQAAQAIRAAGPRAELVQADITDSAAVARVFEVADQLGGCDVLVNSAALFDKRPFTEIDDHSWRKIIDTDLTAPFYCCRAAAKAMRAKGRGDIVNIVDIGGGIKPWRGYAHYCTAKAGLAMLTRCLALELAPEIRVNAIAPGAILFPEGKKSDEERSRTLAAIPMQRTGTTEEVVEAITFLVAGPQFVTGQVLAVDGGRSLA